MKRNFGISDSCEKLTFFHFVFTVDENAIKLKEKKNWNIKIILIVFKIEVIEWYSQKAFNNQKLQGSCKHVLTSMFLITFTIHWRGKISIWQKGGKIQVLFLYKLF